MIPMQNGVEVQQRVSRQIGTEVHVQKQHFVARAFARSDRLGRAVRIIPVGRGVVVGNLGPNAAALREHNGFLVGVKTLPVKVP